MAAPFIYQKWLELELLSNVLHRQAISSFPNKYIIIKGVVMEWLKIEISNYVHWFAM